MNAVTLWFKNGYLCLELFNEETKKIEFQKIKADIVDYGRLVEHSKKLEPW